MSARQQLDELEKKLELQKKDYVAIAQGQEALQSAYFYGANAAVVVALKDYLIRAQQLLHVQIEKSNVDVAILDRQVALEALPPMPAAADCK